VAAPSAPDARTIGVLAMFVVVGLVTVAVAGPAAFLVTVVMAARLSGWHFNRGQRQQLTGAPAEVTTRAVSRAGREFHVDHDIGTVLDKLGEVAVIAANLEPAVLGRHSFADQIVNGLIPIVRPHFSAGDWRSGRLVSHEPYDGLPAHGQIASGWCYDD
jgi:hypothetical protein